MRFNFLFYLGVLALPLCAMGEEPGGTVQVGFSPQSCYWEQTTNTFGVTMISEQGQSGRLALSFASDDRVLVNLRETFDAQAAVPLELRFPVALPAVRPGLIYPLRLQVKLYDETGRRLLVQTGKTVRVVSRAILQPRLGWLKACRLRLFDPEETCVRLLDEAGIPFEPVYMKDAIRTLRDGVLIVGGGVDFAEYPDLDRTLYETAARGVPVLLLSPASGVLRLPEEFSGLRPPSFEGFYNAQSIKKLNDQLDAAYWPPDGCVAGTGLTRQCDGRTTVLQVSEGEGWPIYTVSWVKDLPAFIFCGFEIAQKWRASPVPRLLLIELLEELTVNKKEKL
jgi:hypothetical protein